MMSEYGPIKQCQSCGDPGLLPVMSLGYLPPVNTMRSLDAVPDAQQWFPADLLICNRCRLVQLGYVVDPHVLFPPDYPYTSGTTRILLKNFADLAKQCQQRLQLQASSLVVDVGSNDGSLLKAFREHIQCRVLGIEPTNAAKLAIESGIDTRNAFFDKAVVEEVVRDHGRATLVTATNVFAHIHQVSAVMDAIQALVADDGYFVTESHYLGSVVNGLQYDTIYHEHIRYYSLHSIKYLLESHGFQVFDVETIPTHGGSIRVYATRKSDQQVSRAVLDMLSNEADSGLIEVDGFENFVLRVITSKSQLLSLLTELVEQEKSVVGIGAPSRASTLANFVGLSTAYLQCIYEIAGSAKIGKYLPGTDIPVLEESALYTEQPDFVLLLSWHIAPELCRALKRRGFRGDFIVPLPSPLVIKNNEIA